jgi:hypothetical protein
MNAVEDRRRRRHQVAHDVAARAKRRQQGGVDLGDRPLELALEDAMQLDALPGRDAQGSVRVFAGEIVQIQVLSSGQATAGDPDTHHELVLLLQALLLTAGCGVSIVLLVCAVELEQLIVLF